MSDELKEFSDKVLLALNNLSDDDTHVKYDINEFSDFMQAIMHVSAEKNKRIAELERLSTPTIKTDNTQVIINQQKRIEELEEALGNLMSHMDDSFNGTWFYDEAKQALSKMEA